MFDYEVSGCSWVGRDCSELRKIAGRVGDDGKGETLSIW
jgi:hypothetical protein